MRQLPDCIVPSIAVGRAKILESHLTLMRAQAEDLLARKHMTSENRETLGEIFRESHMVEAELDDWLREAGGYPGGLPRTLDLTTPGWTVRELQEALLTLYPKAATVDEAKNLIPLLHRRIRRVRNQNHRTRFDSEPSAAAEFLFDRADALLCAALQWGGPECRMQANVAKAQLGLLRDARFVRPGLTAPDSRVRLAAIACVAFLQDADAHVTLREIATSDPEPGVREAGLWAYGFAGGPEPLALLVARASQDEHAGVRQFAGEGVDAVEESWWKL
jgi:HEAT repeat protein